MHEYKDTTELDRITAKDTEYIPFAADWRKAMNKISKAKLEQTFGVSGSGLTKSKHIDIIRAVLIVRQFNETYPVGSTVLWKDASAAKVTVNCKAFMHHGMPVVFFNEKPAFCSIEPEHIVIELPF
jgi:hypothetical protein